jgi:cell division septation protein DedD
VAWISADPTAAAKAPVEFDTSGVTAIAAVSDGIPRLVNTLCDRALEVGYERQARTIDGAIVWAAAEQLKLARAQSTGLPAALEAAPVESAETTTRRMFNVRLAIAAVVVVAAATAWFAWMRLSGEPASAAVASAAAVTSTPPAIPASDTLASAPVPQPAAAASSASPTATLPVAPASGTFRISVAAFRTEQRAAAVAAALKERGLPTYTRLDPASEWQLVIAGPFTSSADASAAQRTLAAEGFPDTRVVPDP